MDDNDFIGLGNSTAMNSVLPIIYNRGHQTVIFNGHIKYQKLLGGCKCINNLTVIVTSSILIGFRCVNNDFYKVVATKNQCSRIVDFLSAHLRVWSSFYSVQCTLMRMIVNIRAAMWWFRV